MKKILSALIASLICTLLALPALAAGPGNGIKVQPARATWNTGYFQEVLVRKGLQELGYSVVIYPGAIGRFIGKQVATFLRRLRAEGSTLSQLDQMLDFQSQNQIVDLDGFLERAERYR